ncbi:MAG: hypothetical protein NC301_03185 [Bacteroides sp.]|nr:hypothetical protein [Bacteroides sp.]MCM1378998.1 hypothetical protein [Bacteroides sp.]MCM1445614.1 hypothetical protein [Prevotella sp.]
MKKLIMALAAVALTAGIASATPDKNKKQCNNPQQCPQAQQCNQPCDTACNKPCAPKFCPFDNLNLTDTQKQQLKDLRAKHQQEKKAAKAERKANRKAAKKAHLDEIKVILTPEQYVLFLENSYLYGNAPKMAPGQRPQGGNRDFRPGDRGPKRDKGQAPKPVKKGEPSDQK